MKIWLVGLPLCFGMAGTAVAADAVVPMVARTEVVEATGWRFVVAP